jgi:SnoaL-like domain
MHKHWTAAPLLALALAASNLSAQTCKTTDADKAAVANSLRTLYAGAAIDDMAQMHSVTAPTFYAFDNGQPFSSIDDLMKVVKTYQDRGVKFVWNVTKPQVTIHCNEAWITYVNDGSIQLPNSPPTPTQWLESAVLEKQDGVWKIVFFHSTRVPPPEPPAK